MISSRDFLLNSLQHYFTGKCDFLILQVRFKLSFYSWSIHSHEYGTTVLSDLLPIGAPITYYRRVAENRFAPPP